MTMTINRVIVQASLQGITLKQLHISHTDKVETMLMVCESIYSKNMNMDIKNTVKKCLTSLDF